MRLVLATVFALYVAVVAALPHGHAVGVGGGHDTHECVACTTAGAEPLAAAPTDLEPALAFLERVVLSQPGITASGAPLGAIPGQSPPAA